MRFHAEPDAAVAARRFARLATALRWVAAGGVFLLLMDFLAAVDIAELRSGGFGPHNTDMAKQLLSIFFAALLSASAAWTIGVAAEWACRRPLGRARRAATAVRLEDAARCSCSPPAWFVPDMAPPRIPRSEDDTDGNSGEDADVRRSPDRSGGGGPG